jgi:hypothetical protein
MGSNALTLWQENNPHYGHMDLSRLQLEWPCDEQALVDIQLSVAPKNPLSMHSEIDFHTAQAVAKPGSPPRATEAKLAWPKI